MSKKKAKDINKIKVKLWPLNIPFMEISTVLGTSQDRHSMTTSSLTRVLLEQILRFTANNGFSVFTVEDRKRMGREGYLSQKELLNYFIF